MTPDKVEAALGVLRGGRRSPHCDESRPAGIVFVGEEVSAYDHALSVLTEALAESRRDAARYRWLRSIELGPVYIERILFETISDDHSPPYRSLKHTFDLDTAIDAAMKETP